jgi:hypothetical protein
LISGKIFSGGALTVVARRTLKVSGLRAARIRTIAMAIARTMAMMAMISKMAGSVSVNCQRGRSAPKGY